MAFKAELPSASAHKEPLPGMLRPRTVPESLHKKQTRSRQHSVIVYLQALEWLLRQVESCTRAASQLLDIAGVIVSAHKCAYFSFMSCAVTCVARGWIADMGVNWLVVSVELFDIHCSSHGAIAGEQSAAARKG